MSYRDVKTWIVPALAVMIGVFVVFGSAFDDAETVSTVTSGNVPVVLNDGTASPAIVAVTNNSPELAAASRTSMPARTAIKNADWSKATELKHLRTMYTKTWRTPDYRLRLESSLSPIHYGQPGSMEKIDTSIQLIGSQPATFRPQAALRLPGSDLPTADATEEPTTAEAQDPFAPDATETYPTSNEELLSSDGGDWELANESNTLETYFQGDQAEVRADGYTFALKYAPKTLQYMDESSIDKIGDANLSSANTEGNTVTYNDIFTNVDVVYETGNSSIEQKFIFNSPPRAPADGIDKMKAVLAIGETITMSNGAKLYDNLGQPITGDVVTDSHLQVKGGGEDVMWIYAPTVYDATATVREVNAKQGVPAAKYSVEWKDANTFTLWTEVYYAYFTSDSREYPITVDPNISFQPAGGVGKDARLDDGNTGFFTFIGTDKSNTNYGGATTLVFWDPPDESNGMVQFAGVDTDSIPAGSTIDFAETKYRAQSILAPGATQTYEHGENFVPWDEFVVTFNNYPLANTGPAVGSRSTWSLSGQVDQSTDVTSSVAAYYAGAPNDGWRIHNPTAEERTDLSSSDGNFGDNSIWHPILSVDYTPPPPVIDCALVALCVDPCAGQCVYQVQMTGADPFSQGDQDIEVSGSIDLGPFAFNVEHNFFLIIKLKGGTPKVDFKHGALRIRAADVCLVCEGTSTFSGLSGGSTECLPTCGGDDDDD